MSENGNEMAGLYKKMAGVMGRLARVPKRGRNEFHKYDYATDGDVLDAVRHAMAEETLAFFVTLGKPEMGTVKTRNGDTPLFSLPLTITFADGETGATLSVNWIGQAMDGQDKGINKAATSGVKYCLLKTFLMSTGEDDPDGDSGKQPAKKRQPAKAKAAHPTPENGSDPAPHWIEQENVRKRFWAWARTDRGLTDDQVHEALNCKSVKEYEGTPKMAKEAITAWIAAAAIAAEFNGAITEGV